MPDPERTTQPATAAAMAAASGRRGSVISTIVTAPNACISDVPVPVGTWEPTLELRAGDELLASGPDEGHPLLAIRLGWRLMEDSASLVSRAPSTARFANTVQQLAVSPRTWPVRHG